MGKYDKYYKKSITYNIYMLIKKLAIEEIREKIFICSIFCYDPKATVNDGNIYGVMMDCYKSATFNLDQKRFEEYIKEKGINISEIEKINQELYNILDEKIDGKYYNGTARVEEDNFEPENFKYYDPKLLEKLKYHIKYTKNCVYNMYSMLYFAANKRLPDDFFDPKKFFADDLEEFSREVTQKYGAVSTPSIRQIIELAEREENPNIVALYELADMYYYGNGCIEKDISKAFEKYLDAIGGEKIYNYNKKRFHPLALWSLAYIIHNYRKNGSKLENCTGIKILDNWASVGVDLTDISVYYAFEAYQMMNSPAAANLLGNILSSVSEEKREELGQKYKDLETPDVYYKFARKEGYVYALNNEASREEKLMREATDTEEAIKHCEKMIKCLKESALQHETWASNKLGILYKDGISKDGIVILRTNKDEAYRYFIKAVKHYMSDGSAWACHNLLVFFPERGAREIKYSYARYIKKVAEENPGMGLLKKTRELWPSEKYDDKSFDEFLEEAVMSTKGNIRKKMIIDEMNRMIDEGWTDCIGVSYKDSYQTEKICKGTYTDKDGKVIPFKENTFIDVSSVTKLFTLVTLLKLFDEDKLDFDKRVSDYTGLESYVNIQDLKLYEILNFSKNIETTKRIDECDKNEIKNLLINGTVKDKVFYSDIGSIIITYMIDDIFGEGFFRNYSKKLWEETGLENTFWWDEIPEEKISLLQSYDNEYRYNNENGIYCFHAEIGEPHDPKSRKLGASGHAGIFTTLDDISLFAEKLIEREILSGETIEKFIVSDSYDSYADYGQHFGILCYKRAKNLTDSEIPETASDKSIAISGYTGVYLLLDFENRKFVFIGSNRVFNRMTSETPSSVRGGYIKNTKKYVYRKDTLRDLCC